MKHKGPHPAEPVDDFVVATATAPENSKLPEAQEEPPGSLAQVSITEIIPTPEQIAEVITDDPVRRLRFVETAVKDKARLVEVAPLIEKGKKRSETESRSIGKANVKRKQDAQAARERDRGIASKLCQQSPALKGASRERLAQEVQIVLARRGIPRSTKSIKQSFLPKK